MNFYKNINKPYLINLLILLFSFSLNGQNAIVGTGFSSGWGGSCGTNTDFDYFSSHAGGSYGNTETALGTGNQYFRLGVDWSGTTGQHTITLGSDTEVITGVEYTLNSTCTTNGAMFTNVTNASDVYYFKTFNADANPDFRMIFFKVQGIVQSVNSVTQTPISTAVTEGQTVTVTANLSSAFAIGQAVFLRYSNNIDISASTVLKMTGTGTTYTATIPAFNEGQNVYYYIFTSGDVASISGANADFYTINLNDNSGVRYSYTVLAPLPIKLSSFEASKNKSTIALHWQTATEINNSHFNIQRSNDSKTWNSIGKIAGKGNSLQVQNYTYTDEKPLNPTNYYRLKQVDFDNKFSYSQIVMVENSTLDVSVFPNPMNDYFELKIPNPSGKKHHIQLINTKGQIITQIITKEVFLKVETHDLLPGLYVLRLIDELGNLLFVERLSKL